jgi:hypothetical protein
MDILSSSVAFNGCRSGIMVFNEASIVVVVASSRRVGIK